MEKNYAYNPRTGVFHIKGYCQFTEFKNADWKYFYTEEDVRSRYEGRARLCTVCRHTRDNKIMKGGVNK